MTSQEQLIASIRAAYADYYQDTYGIRPEEHPYAQKENETMIPDRTTPNPHLSDKAREALETIEREHPEYAGTASINDPDDRTGNPA